MKSEKSTGRNWNPSRIRASSMLYTFHETIVTTCVASRGNDIFQDKWFSDTAQVFRKMTSTSVLQKQKLWFHKTLVTSD